MMTSVTEPSGKRSRPTLTREQIAAVALNLIDEDGLEAFSMRRLGTRLGVEAMAIYHHFENKGDLLDAVMDCLLDEMPEAKPAPPMDRLRQSMCDYRAIATRHPRAFILLAARRFNTERAFAWYERLLATFAEVGLDPAGTALWFRLIGGYASAAGMAEVASRELVPDATRLRLEHAAEALPYPHVRAVAPHLKVDQLRSTFEYSLDILFNALAIRLAAAAAGAETQ